MCPYTNTIHSQVCFLSDLLTQSTSSYCCNILDHYWGTLLIILYLHTICSTTILGYLRIRSASAHDNIKPFVTSRTFLRGVQNQTDCMPFQTPVCSCGSSDSLQTWVEMPSEVLKHTFAATDWADIKKKKEKKKKPPHRNSAHLGFQSAECSESSVHWKLYISTVELILQSSPGLSVLNPPQRHMFISLWNSKPIMGSQAITGASKNYRGSLGELIRGRCNCADGMIK